MSKVVKTIKLIKTDAKNNNNKFWQGELMDNDDVVCSWGRVGATSPQSKEFPSAGDSYIEKKKREKEKKGYREVKAVNKVATGDDSSKVVVKNSLEDVAKRQIKHTDKLVSKLIETLVSTNRHQIMSMSGGQIEVDADGMVKTVLGDVLDTSSISEARTYLAALGDFLKNSGASRGTDDFDKDDWIDNLNGYLKIVPQKVNHRRGWHRSLWTDLSEIQAQSAFLDQLESSVQLATDAAKDATKKGSKKVKEQSVFDTSLDTLNNQKEFDRINRFFKKHAKQMHASCGFKLDRVYKVKVKSVYDKYQKMGAEMDNIWELWHGTSVSNVLSILKGGYVVPPANAAHVTGRLYGPGLYLSDMSTKSLNYSYGYWSGRYSRDNCYMFLNDVAMGNIFYPKGQRSSAPPRGYDSYFAKAGQSGVINNEMIVKDVAQVNIKYLCEFSK